MVVDVIDLCDEAEKSILMASNYLDVRVMEACFRSVDRGVTNRLIVGNQSLSSKLKNLRMMLSLTFAKTLINFTTNKVNIREFLKFVDLPYTFCVVDGYRTIIEINNTINEQFIVALSIDNRNVGEKLTKFFETLWNAGDFQSAIEVLESINPS